MKTKLFVSTIVLNLLMVLMSFSQTADTAFFPAFQSYSLNPIIKYGDGFADAAWNDPTVLKVNGQYIMYISAAAGFLGTDQVKIYRMVSTDGYSWNLTP